MKWFSWFRRKAPAADTVVMPAPAGRPSGRPSGPQPRRVDWNRIDQAAEGEDPFATSKLALQPDDTDDGSGSRRAKQAYNPYDTGAFVTGVNRMPDLHRDRAGRPSAPAPKQKTAYDPYDTGSFHGSWNRNSR